MLLQLYYVQETPTSLVKMYILTQQVRWWGWEVWRLTFCISNKLMGEADTAGLWTTLWVAS